MAHYNPNMATFCEMHGMGIDHACCNLPHSREEPEDWSDLRWRLTQVADTLQGRLVLMAFVRAEQAALEYLDDHPAPARPDPDWLSFDDDNLGDEKL